MFKVYGSQMCPDCINLKGNFDAYKIEYEFIDINDNLRNLKEFLILRDSLPVFDRLKKINDIGIPAIVKEDGEVFVNWEEYLMNKGLKVKEYYQGNLSCSLDHKGGC
ncbi:MAG: glutaredoxin [Gammaproteobacteria bacterium]|nr:glutaredoxin [Gammaproteobacteria bacterium]